LLCGFKRKLAVDGVQSFAISCICFLGVLCLSELTDVSYDNTSFDGCVFFCFSFEYSLHVGVILLPFAENEY
jgi:hypothetical protein